MNYGNLAEALEIGIIERQDAFDRIDFHDGNETGIVNLDSLHVVAPNDLFPCWINCRDIWKQSQELFNVVDFTQRFRDR